MINPTPPARAHWRLRFALGAVAAVLFGTPATVDAQGLVQGVQQGAKEGNKAAGPVGAVLGGAIGGVAGVFTGVLGVGKNAQTPPANDTKANDAKQPGAAKTAKGAKVAKGAKPQQPDQQQQQDQPVLTQEGAPQLSAEQIVASSDANIERIKNELNLTPV
jgi:hypothetical protein